MPILFNDRLDRNCHDGLLVADEFAHLVAECDTVSRALTLSTRIAEVIKALEAVERAALQRGDAICNVNESQILVMGAKR